MSIPDPIDAAALDTDEEVLERARDLVQRALRRQVWLLLLDEEGRQLPVLPQIEIPKKPDAFAVAHFASRLCDMAGAAGASAMAVVYERPGSEKLTFTDRQWLRLLAGAGADRGVGLRGPMLAHARGVRWVGPEDLDDPGGVVVPP